MRHLPPIHIWVPELADGGGGIQAFSRVYVQALKEGFPERRIRVLVKNDSLDSADPLRRPGVVFSSVSQLPTGLRAPALAAMGIAAGLLERPAVAVTTHLHFLPAMQWLHRFYGTPTASVLHGVEAWDLKHRGRLRALRQANHLMAVSNFTRQSVCRTHALPEAAVSVVPNTFDVERFSVGPKPAYLLTRYQLRPEQPLLLTVSRLAQAEQYKGHRQVLKALPQIRTMHRDVRYLIAGDGDDRPLLEREVADLGLRDVVTFAGRIPNAELADHYRLCDCFVMPSSREGFGIVFLEAMASGKPVVAGNADGSVDAVDGGRLGLLVNPNHPAEIADAVNKILSRATGNPLLQDPALLRTEVVRLFGYERVSRLLAEDLRPIVEGRGGASN
jgi:glycosyltransferase involved in cell wall biosynthesis